jgi:hypothetical protein
MPGLQLGSRLWLEVADRGAYDCSEIAPIVGPGRLVASTSCGSRTLLNLEMPPLVVQKKLEALVAGPG